MTVLYPPTLADVTVPPPAPSAADWNDDGVVILPGFFDTRSINEYVSEWQEYNADSPGGYDYCTPYMDHRALRNMVCDGGLQHQLEKLTGEPMGVHLNLTGMVSTERDWHQDSYLNPPNVGDYYAAVWFCLGYIDVRSGPFQYVPGSHRWPQVTRELIGRHVDIRDPAWPKLSEDVLSPLFEAEIKARNANVVTYLPDCGDVLCWHGRLLHRGSKPQVPGMRRPALIAHYSSVRRRPDMPPAIQHGGGWLFPIFEQVPVR